jgi:hypothetical protein
MVTLSASDIKHLKRTARKACSVEGHDIGRFRRDFMHESGVLLYEIYFSRCSRCKCTILISVDGDTGEPDIHGSCLVYRCGEDEVKP